MDTISRLKSALSDLIKYNLRYARKSVNGHQFYEVRNDGYVVKSFATRIGESQFGDIEALVNSVESWKVMNGIV